jgi:hypothetical protein
MGEDDATVDLGFAKARVPAGTHVCQIYSDADERSDALLRFLSRGLQCGESTACFTENVGEEELEAWFAKEGLSLAGERASGRFASSPTRSVYFQDGRFDPDRMLELLTRFHQDSVAAGRSGARVIGEMSPEISTVPGGFRLLEYESRVNRLLQTHPITAVCQYDARCFDGATIMDVLTVHPMMVVRGAVVLNPFFTAPEELARR